MGGRRFSQVDTMPTTSDAPRRLRRKDAAAFLTAAGYPISAATLATKVTRGDGPPFCVFGRDAFYEESVLLAWAESRTSYRGGAAPDQQQVAA